MLKSFENWCLMFMLGVPKQLARAIKTGFFTLSVMPMKVTEIYYKCVILSREGISDITEWNSFSL